MIVTLTIRPAAELPTFYQVMIEMIRILRTLLKTMAVAIGALCRIMALVVIVVTTEPAVAWPANQDRLRPQRSKHGDVGLWSSRYGRDPLGLLTA